jgi:hypothetical protein
MRAIYNQAGPVDMGIPHDRPVAGCLDCRRELQVAGRDHKRRSDVHRRGKRIRCEPQCTWRWHDYLLQGRVQVNGCCSGSRHRDRGRRGFGFSFADSIWFRLSSQIRGIGTEQRCIRIWRCGISSQHWIRACGASANRCHGARRWCRWCFCCCARLVSLKRLCASDAPIQSTSQRETSSRVFKCSTAYLRAGIKPFLLSHSAAVGILFLISEVFLPPQSFFPVLSLPVHMDATKRRSFKAV